MFIYKYKKIDGLIRQQKSRQSSLRLRKVNYYFIFIFIVIQKGTNTLFGLSFSLTYKYSSDEH